MEEQGLPEDPPINASKFKYVGVWILYAFLTGLINQIINLFLLRPLRGRYVIRFIFRDKCSFSVYCGHCHFYFYL